MHLAGGKRFTEAGSVVKMMEDGVLKDSGLTLESLRGPFSSYGARRAVRFFPKDMRMETGADERGPFFAIGVHAAVG